MNKIKSCKKYIDKQKKKCKHFKCRYLKLILTFNKNLTHHTKCFKGVLIYSGIQACTTSITASV